MTCKINDGAQWDGCTYYMSSSGVDSILLCHTVTKCLSASTVSPWNFRKGDSLIRAKQADRVCFSFIFCAAPTLAKKV